MPAPVSPASGEEAGVSIAACRVLVVEDNILSQRLIGSILGAAGIGNLEFADDGVEALAKLASFDPDMVILDIMMPRMDGLEFLRHLRADPRRGTVPVLVQTALGTREARDRIYKAGATDMLSKPISAGELLIRVCTHLENRMLLKSAQDRLRLEAEVNAARLMQEALLPQAALLDEIHARSALRIDAHFETSSELGGDLWGVRRSSQKRAEIFIVDFSGHGLGAAVNTFRLHALMSNHRPLVDDPAAYLSLLNEQLLLLLPRGQFATMFLGIIDSAGDSLTYAAAAQPPPLLGRLGSRHISFPDTSGIPLAMKKGAVYENRRVDFPPGSFLFLYSDALIETPLGGGEILDREGVGALLLDCLAARDEASPMDRLAKRFREMRTAPLGDDLTAVLAWREA